MNTLSGIACLLIACCYQCNSAHGTSKHDSKQLNVLVLAMPASGHTAVPLALAEELTRRGHNVTFVTAGNKYKSAAEKVGLSFKSNGYPYGMIEIAKKNQGNLFVLMRHLPRWFSNETGNFVNFLKEIDVSNNSWDIVISTEFLQTLLACVGDQWKIPTVMVSTSTQSQPHTYPTWPWASHIVGGFSDNLRFYQRLASALERIIFPTLYSYIMVSSVKSSTDDLCPQASYSYLATAPGVYMPAIVPTVIGFEYPRTISPLTHYVGPVLSKTPEPMYDILQNWLDKKRDKSVVYISMGSMGSLAKEEAEAIKNGVIESNHSAVWAIRRSEDFDFRIDPERFFVAEWLPQQSVLQHSSISMAIMHGGMNGIHESLSNGLPLIILPIQPEQLANSGRIQNQGLGIYLDKKTINSSQVAESIREINSGEYRNKVYSLQKMFAQAGGVDKAAELVEFYADVGYNHLIPAYAKYQWSWIQYHNVDAYLILLAITAVIMYVDFKLIQKCRNCLATKKKIE